jgi:hypothetical protein
MALLAAVGCDLEVTNAGPVDETGLDSPAAMAALVNGMTRTLARAESWLAFTGAGASRELMGNGLGANTGFGITARVESGVLEGSPDENDLHWQYAHQARWVAEDGVRRMRRVLGTAFDASPLAARALLHAGFANRLLGENMCHAVFDGGPLEQRGAYFTRAEGAFTDALAIATAIGHDSLSRAARAGRAAARVWLGDWMGAMTDASAVPVGFKYVLPNSSIEQDLYNRVYWSSANQPFRNSTVWSTFYEGYRASVVDPRVAWVRHPTVTTMITGRPWLIQDKYRTRDAPITLASEREMRLIVAEGRLRAGDWQGSLAVLNALRAEVGVAGWSASSATEVWTALKRERGIELWLEGRRLGDLDRWLSEGTPGAADDMTGRDRCFPIGQTELDTNANLAGLTP